MGSHNDRLIIDERANCKTSAPISPERKNPRALRRSTRLVARGFRSRLTTEESVALRATEYAARRYLSLGAKVEICNAEPTWTNELGAQGLQVLSHCRVRFVDVLVASSGDSLVGGLTRLGSIGTTYAVAVGGLDTLPSGEHASCFGRHSLRVASAWHAQDIDLPRRRTSLYKIRRHIL